MLVCLEIQSTCLGLGPDEQVDDEAGGQVLVW